MGRDLFTDTVKTRCYLYLTRGLRARLAQAICRSLQKPEQTCRFPTLRSL